MFRIRFHGRGGQGMKTASRILGRTLFLQGYEIQDAPRYGAERRGAPIFAYVRADTHPIYERGIISQPDLIVVADDSLLGIPAAGVLSGYSENTVLLLLSPNEASVWRERLNFPGPVLVHPLLQESEKRFRGAACAGAAARLLANIDADILSKAVAQEIAPLHPEKVEANIRIAAAAFDLFSSYAGVIKEGMVIKASEYDAPRWIELPFENAGLAAPAIHASATSENLKTGLWRTERPEIDEKRCNRCWWICSTFCPDGAIHVDDGRRPYIDYDHCKGCMICLAQCPTHAIEARPEDDRQLSGGNGS